MRNVVLVLGSAANAAVVFVQMMAGCHPEGTYNRVHLKWGPDKGKKWIVLVSSCATFQILRLVPPLRSTRAVQASVLHRGTRQRGARCCGPLISEAGAS